MSYSGALETAIAGVVTVKVMETGFGGSKKKKKKKKCKYPVVY